MRGSAQRNKVLRVACIHANVSQPLVMRNVAEVFAEARAAGVPSAGIELFHTDLFVGFPSS